MVGDEDHSSSEHGENVMLREAIEALRTGDRARARDLLTRLLKTDQKNAQYWVWLSAAVDTQKERLYCLQTAIRADPQNAAAKRGLILLGALPPDDNVPPFPVNRPRPWEDKYAIRDTQEKVTGWANPVTRVFIALGIAVIVLGLFIGGRLLSSRGSQAAMYRSPTRYPTATLSPTPTDTVIPSLRTATPTFWGPTPLWMFLDKTYTPTPLYVVTQHPITSRSAFEAGMRFLEEKDYQNALVLFKQAEGLEPDAPDIYYYIGETYRAQGSFHDALDQYQKAINQDSNFAPAFLGRARANLGLHPHADVSNDLNEAIALDPRFAEAYIERGKYRLAGDPSAAETDFEAAITLAPDSAPAYLYLADAQLAQGENEAALTSAQHANELDITLIPVYLTLAKAYIATGQSEQAVSVLQTYLVYDPDDTSAFLDMGMAYNAAGKYQLAVNILNKAIDADPHNAKAYSQRGYAYLNLQEGSLAQADFKLAITYDSSDLDSQLGLAQALDEQKKPGDAYMRVQSFALPLAKTDAAKAEVYYWEAFYLKEIGDPLSLQGARNALYLLIALPADVMPADWRTEAYQYLNITPTFTPTLTSTKTPTFTPTATSTSTATSTASPTQTLMPTSTP